jgi:adenosylcobinamide-phosphate synthase
MDYYSIINQPEKLIIPLVLGWLIDFIVGDPYWLPHPIRLFGNIIAYADKKNNRNGFRKLKGFAVVLFLLMSTFAAFYGIIYLSSVSLLAYYIAATILVYYGLANRCLIYEAKKVESELTINGLEAGRKQLSYIVGRETKTLNENQIRTAVLETLSENLSDGVIAPLFYYAIGGIPLMFTYKMVNTLDSMIGYKNDKYRQFGWLAARTDDVLNFIPARITALLMVLVTFNYRGFVFVLKYGNKHASPNSGYPESALAGILNCRFGGPNTYHGVLVNKPFIGDNARTITSKDISRACWINILASVVFVLLILGLFLMLKNI